MPPMSSSTTSAMTEISSMTFLPASLPSLIALRMALAPASRVNPASPSPAIWSCFVNSGSASMIEWHARVMASRNSFSLAAGIHQLLVSQRSLTRHLHFLGFGDGFLLNLLAEFSWLACRCPSPSWCVGLGVKKLQDPLWGVLVALLWQE